MKRYDQAASTQPVWEPKTLCGRAWGRWSAERLEASVGMGKLRWPRVAVAAFQSSIDTFRRLLPTPDLPLVST